MGLDYECQRWDFWSPKSTSVMWNAVLFLSGWFFGMCLNLVSFLCMDTTNLSTSVAIACLKELLLETQILSIAGVSSFFFFLIWAFATITNTILQFTVKVNWISHQEQPLCRDSPDLDSGLLAEAQEKGKVGRRRACSFLWCIYFLLQLMEKRCKSVSEIVIPGCVEWGLSFPLLWFSPDTQIGEVKHTSSSRWIWWIW